MTTTRLFLFLVVAIYITTSAYIIKPSSSVHLLSDQLPTRVQVRDSDQATPAPTGESSPDHTVEIDPIHKRFCILLPSIPRGSIADSESDAMSYCTPGYDQLEGRQLRSGFIISAEYQQTPDYIQVTGCFNPKAFPFSPNDMGGQYDVRYPNGAQCTFGGYGASFIEQVEPNNRRFCLRCCAQRDDQEHCNSHNDKDGCPTAIPGNYSECP